MWAEQSQVPRELEASFKPCDGQILKLALLLDIYVDMNQKGVISLVNYNHRKFQSICQVCTLMSLEPKVSKVECSLQFAPSWDMRGISCQGKRVRWEKSYLERKWSVLHGDLEQFQRTAYREGTWCLHGVWSLQSMQQYYGEKNPNGNTDPFLCPRCPRCFSKHFIFSDSL